jgi:hypothetical protein
LRIAFLCATLIGAAGCGLSSAPPRELVIPTGDVLGAPGNVGRFSIQATSTLERRFTWPGGSISLSLTPRATRWYGELGGYIGGLPAPSNVLDHAVIEEGQLYFHSRDELLRRHLLPNLGAAPEERKHWTSDGLSAWFLLDDRSGARILHIDIEQWCVNGAKPAHLPHADDAVSIRDSTGRALPSLPCHAPAPEDYYTTWLHDHVSD